MIKLKLLYRSSLRVRVLLVILVLSWMAIGLSPRSAYTQSTDLTLHTVDDTSFPTVNVVLSANEGTRPVKDLTLEDFTLAEDGKIVPIANVSTLDSGQFGVSLILVLDVSLSMQANNGITAAKAAALTILDRLRPIDRVALIAFSEGVVVDVSTLNPEREIAFTTDKAAVRALINGLEAGGATALYDATLKGIRMSQDEARGSRAMILLSDGRDERFEGEDRVAGSTFRDSDVILEARDTNMPIFTIGLGTNIDRSFLSRLADQSGGSFQETPDPTQLEAFFNNALDQLLQRYVIQYQSQVNPDTGDHVLLVQVDKGSNVASTQTTFASQAPEIPGIRLNLQEGEEVEGSVTVRPTIFAKNPITKVEFLVDDQVVREDTTDPYVYTWNAANRTFENNSSHKITVRATDNLGVVGETTVNLTVLIEPTPIPTDTPSPTSTLDPSITPSATVTTDPNITPTATITPAVVVTPTVVNGDGEAPPWWREYLPWILVGLAIVLGLLIGWLLWRQRNNNEPPDYIPEPPPPAPLPGPYSGGTYPPSNVGAVESMPFTGVPPISGIGIPPTYPASTTPDPMAQGPVPTVSGIGGMNVPADARPDGTVILNRKWISAQFVEVQGQRVGHNYPLLNQHNPQQTKRVRIGREPRENDVVLDDPRISRQQAVLLYEKGGFTLFNNAIERNPIVVQGKRITQPVTLQDNDVVQMGGTQLRFLVLRSDTA